MSVNKVIMRPLWAILVGGLVAGMVVAPFVFVQSGEAAQAADEQPSSASVSPMIVGGTEVPNGKYPFMAFIKVAGSGGDLYTCGGSLIDRDSVLTAAHCLENSVGARVVVGRTDLKQRNQGQVRGAARPFIHPRFNLPSYAYDVAVLKVKHAVTGIQPIKLATAKQNYLETPGRKLTVAGWGNTTERGNLSNRMREVSVPVVSDAKARRSYASEPPYVRYRPSIMMAAGVKGKDHCFGDSGGPLFKPGTPSTQVGVASYAKGCARAGYPGVSTEVNNPNIRNFILWAAKR